MNKKYCSFGPSSMSVVLGMLTALVLATPGHAGSVAPAKSSGQGQASTSAVTHICLAAAAVQMLTNGEAAESAMSAAFAGFLQGPTIRATTLSARLQTQVRLEAQQAKCSFVLFQTLKQERHSSGLLGRIAASAFQSGAVQAADVVQTTEARVLVDAAAGAAANLADTVSGEESRLVAARIPTRRCRGNSGRPG